MPNEAIVALEQAVILDGIKEILHEVTGIPVEKVTPEAHFIDDLDLDSLSMVEIAVQAEDTFGIKIPDEAIAGLHTVDGAVQYVYDLYLACDTETQATAAERAVVKLEELRNIRKNREPIDDCFTGGNTIPPRDVVAVATELCDDVNKKYGLDFHIDDFMHMSIETLCRCITNHIV